MTDDSSNETDSSTAHDRLGHLLDSRRHRRGEHALAKIGVRAGGDDLVRLLDKVELEEFIGFIENEMANAEALRVSRGLDSGRELRRTWRDRKSVV